MQEKNLGEWVVATIAEMCQEQGASVSLETHLADLGLDSMGLGIFASLAEVTWGCEVNEHAIERLLLAVSIADVVKVLEDIIAGSTSEHLAAAR